jgi:hypothetical protein
MPRVPEGFSGLSPPASASLGRAGAHRIQSETCRPWNPKYSRAIDLRSITRVDVRRLFDRAVHASETDFTDK